MDMLQTVGPKLRPLAIWIYLLFIIILLILSNFVGHGWLFIRGRNHRIERNVQGIDTDNSGTIILEELKHGLAKQGTKLFEYEVKQLMEAVSSLSILVIHFLQLFTLFLNSH